MILTGTFERAIDEKLRVSVPKSLREALLCKSPPSSAKIPSIKQHGVVYVAPGTDGSLSIYTEEAFSSLAERLAGVSPTEQHVRAFTRLFYARAQRAELDRQGRIRISTELAELAGLGREAVMIGVQDHLELWSVERWKRYLEERKARYDEIAEAAFGMKTT
ncbi:MAG: division/cell wall cluster transcriptional repressor MraZ [Pirellulales bacterium]|nr:division/cell wall cluster transcriptional repressor MraZ [Pirellulales bacterium]